MVKNGSALARYRGLSHCQQVKITIVIKIEKFCIMDFYTLQALNHILRGGILLKTTISLVHKHGRIAGNE